MKLRLKSAALASALGCLILIALIWFAGPLFGLDGVERRVTWIIAVALLWGVSLLIGRLLSSRAGWLVEKMLLRQADDAVVRASAERRAEVNELRRRLLEAIHTLKTSRLGKARGNAALYELPWYMIIGHPSAGKSTALLQSGLTFPFGDNHAAVQGIGGTRSCDWFFSTEGVLLDTAGRYSTEADDRSEWLDFLALLKRHRSKAPVNGIIVATSLPELMQYRADGYTAYARQIRERVHEIEDIFGLQAPVYLMFTKLDLLGGFTQFFEDAGEDERARVWGATLSHEQGAGFDIRRVVAEQYELLYRGLKRMGEGKLGQARGGAGARPALFAFPLEFHALKEGICRFVELLHEDDPYHAKPLVRGIYFTSALQAGEPSIAGAARVSRQFDLSHSGFGPAQPASTRGYFLRGLFREVIFPDQYLVTRQTRPRADRLRLASMTAGLAALGGVAAVLTQSWLGNDEMIALAAKDRTTAAARIADDSLAARLGGLVLLQARLEELQRHRLEGVPWRIGMGLYQGRGLETALRRQYFSALRAIMLTPIQTRLETALGQLGPEWSVDAETDKGASDAAYDALKTYLMLASRPRLEANYLAEQLPRNWQPFLEAQHVAADGGESDAAQVAGYYLSQLQAPDLPLIDNDEAIIMQARKTLRSVLTQVSARERVYSVLRDRANAKFPSLTVEYILGGRDAGLLAGAREVPGAFTRDAWEKYLRDAIAEASRGTLKGEDWVLAVTGEDNPGKDSDIGENRAALEALYRAEYADAWTKFLPGVTVRSLGGITRAEQVMARFSDPQNSPIKILLRRAAYETAWDNPGQIAASVETARQSVLERTVGLLRGGNVRAPNTGQEAPGARHGALGQRFAFLAALSSEDKPSPLMTGYQEHLSRLKTRYGQIAAADDTNKAARALMKATLDGSGSELAEALKYIDGTLLAATDPASRELLRPLLVQPLLQGYAVLIPPVEEHLNQLWENEVYDIWRTLADKYPFQNVQTEAPLDEIASFIKSGEGTIPVFIEESLGGLVSRRGNKIVPRTWQERGVRFNAAFLGNAERLLALSGALARGGGASRFELQPVPTPGLSEIVVEIDEQILHYRNGPQSWQTFRWPGGEEEGVRIQVVDFNGLTSVISSHSGRMGLIRMFGESARDFDQIMTQGQLAWPIARTDETRTRDAVKLNFRMVGGINPMQLAALGRVSLPRRITE
ncbi:MAG: type VI secretion system membrane subunit TssM [Azoarcus sp.]|jgi:type VI secretion system protein ImpL|nr:type VI secretion system membrane subunit TssM [Azoarcus sp.]